MSSFVQSSCVCAKLLQLCPTFCNPMVYRLPGSPVHVILQATILERVAMPSSGGSSQMALGIKNPPANVRDIRDVGLIPRDTGLIPGSGRSPGEGHGNPLQYSRLGNPMDRGAWQDIIHGFAQSWT